MGLGHDVLARTNPRIIQLGIKGFLKGPYENRNLLDEAAQMMGGLAYMTGPPGNPLRAGASIVDITGAMFAVISILAALLRRESTGQGEDIRVGLFETVVFLVSQHVAKAGISGEVPPPMTLRGAGFDLGWGIYKVFLTADGRPVFIGVTSDSQWQSFCREFGFEDLWSEPKLRTNAGRREEFERLTNRTADKVRTLTFSELLAILERANIPPRAGQYPAGPVRASPPGRPASTSPGCSHPTVPACRFQTSRWKRSPWSVPNPSIRRSSASTPRRSCGELGFEGDELLRLCRAAQVGPA